MIISYNNREFSLGGAGNAAQNLAALGVDVEAVGVVGADEGGREVRRLLSRAGVSDRMIVAEKGFATPLKTRILAGEENTKKQQILRIDREGEVPGEVLLRAGLQSSLSEAAASCDALLVSDYHYRTVDEDVLRQSARKPSGRPGGRSRLIRVSVCFSSRAPRSPRPTNPRSKPS